MAGIEHQAGQDPQRAALRAHLKAARRDFLASPAGQAAPAALLQRLVPLIQQLEPLCLGLYWPLPGEFDAAGLLPGVDGVLSGVQLALPFAQRDGRMQYRRWDGRAPTQRDEMGIACSDGAAADPDLVLVPCLGFTRDGYRLGYGGGFFDRWQAEHAGVTTLGLAWQVGECAMRPAAHDQALSILVTEVEVLAP